LTISPIYPIYKLAKLEVSKRQDVKTKINHKALEDTLRREAWGRCPVAGRNLQAFFLLLAEALTLAGRRKGRSPLPSSASKKP
jgi:hypothetical protein